MPDFHARFGGSTIARTLACPAWVNLAGTLPKNDNGSTFADEGTLLHNCAEEYFKSTERTSLPTRMLAEGRHFKDQHLTQELMDEKLSPAIKSVLALLRELDIQPLKSLEPFVSIIDDLAGGSIDMLGLSKDGKTLLILDYKFGHHRVPAEDNKQLLFYALCAMVDESHGLDISRVETLALVIIQPEDGECTPDIWTVPEDVLNEFEDEVYAAIDLAEANPDDGSNAVAGDHCRFCPAEAICPVKSGMAARALRITPEQTDLLFIALPLAAQLESWIKAVRKLAHEQAELGTPINGYKLVNKRSRRVWNDPEAAAHKIRKMRGVTIVEAQTHELKSPPQVEKLFKSKGVDFAKVGDYISSVSSGTTLVPEDDKREEALAIGALKLTLDSLT